MSKIMLVVVTLGFCVMFFHALSDLGKMPVVALDQHDECQWIMLYPTYEKEQCPIVLPEKYEVVYVRSVNVD